MRHLVRFFRLPGTNTCTPIQNQGLSQIYSASPIRFIEALLHKCNYHTMSRFLDPQFIVNQYEKQVFVFLCVLYDGKNVQRLAIIPVKGLPCY